MRNRGAGRAERRILFIDGRKINFGGIFLICNGQRRQRGSYWRKLAFGARLMRIA